MQIYNIFLTFLVLMIFVGGWSDTSAKHTQYVLETEECLEPFDGFAYQILGGREEERVLPNAPWQIVTSLPSHMNQQFPVTNQVEITRMINDSKEIWITGHSQAGPIFAIYNVGSQRWEVVSRTVYGTDLFAEQLFVLHDGSVWGQNKWKHLKRDLPQDEIPVVSKFNEITRQFEAPQGVMHVSVAQNQAYYYGQAISPWPMIKQNKHNGFWIIVNYTGVFHYDVIAQTVKHVIDLPEIPIQEAALSLDGVMYFTTPTNALAKTTRALFTISEGMLLQFRPRFSDIKVVKMPDEEWPIFNGMVVDRIGRLWLGSIGYRELDGSWNLIHPDPELFFDHAGEYLWAPPTLMMESSDGRLWYHKWLDTGGGNEGTAWYDPETGIGCMFTTYAANIVEDSENQLWLVADGDLYKYTLPS